MRFTQVICGKYLCTSEAQLKRRATHLSKSIRSRSFIAQKVSYWLTHQIWLTSEREASSFAAYQKNLSASGPARIIATLLRGLYI